MNDTTRFQDSGKHLADFGGEYLIHCPKCNTAARIFGGKLRCWNCGLALDKRDDGGISKSDSGHYFEGVSIKNWFGDVTARAIQASSLTTRPTCQKCGAQFEGLGLQARKNSPRLPNSSSATCSGCNTENKFKLSWHPFLPADQPRDPLFGCKLLLQKEFKEGTLYAYNDKHAAEYIKYIQANQRERQPSNTGKRSFFTSLPAWIKSAKNRDAIAKELQQLIILAQKLV